MKVENMQENRISFVGGQDKRALLTRRQSTSSDCATRPSPCRTMRLRPPESEGMEKKENTLQKIKLLESGQDKPSLLTQRTTKTPERLGTNDHPLFDNAYTEGLMKGKA